jgi:hypothetical protein
MRGNGDPAFADELSPVRPTDKPRQCLRLDNISTICHGQWSLPHRRWELLKKTLAIALVFAPSLFLSPPTAAQTCSNPNGCGTSDNSWLWGYLGQLLVNLLSNKPRGNQSWWMNVYCTMPPGGSGAPNPPDRVYMGAMFVNAKTIPGIEKSCRNIRNRYMQEHPEWYGSCDPQYDPNGCAPVPPPPPPIIIMPPVVISPPPTSPPPAQPSPLVAAPTPNVGGTAPTAPSTYLPQSDVMGQARSALQSPSVARSALGTATSSTRPGGARGMLRAPGDRAGPLSDPLFYSAQFCAAWGDTLSLGITCAIREAAGINDVIDPTSTAYQYGDYFGTGVAIGLGGTQAVRGALAMGGQSGTLASRVGRGALRFVSDPRQFRTASRQYWDARGRAGASRTLHHWYRPQRAGGSNAGWNLLQLPRWLNSRMGPPGPWRMMEQGIRWGVLLAPPSAAAWGGYWGAYRQDWINRFERE